MLVVGARTSAGPANAQLFDPTTDTWSSVGSSSNPNLDLEGHTATLLPNGKVLVVGGMHLGSATVGTAALFNPANNTWSTVASLPVMAERAHHAATLLANGRVLVSGGRHFFGEHTSRYVYHPLSDLWTTPASYIPARVYHTLTLLGNGKVLAAGGATDSCDVYDPASNTWSGIIVIGARISPTATLLNDGKVLIAGGLGSSNARRTAYIYDPVANIANVTGEMNDARYAHAAVRFGNGKVLVVGGSAGSALSSAEIYTP
ncbi:hypothetical protein BE20_08485 [Sorangium cellulosum]|nr:hypothetical protein BE20_08485 [Sorangium cellulosum]